MSVTAVPIHPIRKGSVAKLWVGLAALSLGAAGLTWAGTANQIYTTTSSGLQYRVIKEGEGPHPTASDVALVDYTGKLEDGSVFDTSKGKQPIPLPLAPGGAIPGFTEGVELMSKGATYEFRIPYRLAYGEQGHPPVIPPKANLVFEVTLIDFLPQSMLQGMMSGAPPQGR